MTAAMAAVVLAGLAFLTIGFGPLYLAARDRLAAEAVAVFDALFKGLGLLAVALAVITLLSL